MKTLNVAGRTMDFISTLTFDSALILSQLLCSLYKLLLQVQLIPDFFFLAEINTTIKTEL